MSWQKQTQLLKVQRASSLPIPGSSPVLFEEASAVC
jgi:hypothetical protein